MQMPEVDAIWNKLMDLDITQRYGVLSHLFGQYQAAIQYDYADKAESEEFFNRLEQAIGSVKGSRSA